MCNKQITMEIFDGIYLVDRTRSSSWSIIGWNKLTMPSASVSRVGLSHKFSVFSSIDVMVLSLSFSIIAAGQIATIIHSIKWDFVGHGMFLLCYYQNSFLRFTAWLQWFILIKWQFYMLTAEQWKKYPTFNRFSSSSRFSVKVFLRIVSFATSAIQHREISSKYLKKNKNCLLEERKIAKNTWNFTKNSMNLF